MDRLTEKLYNKYHLCKKCGIRYGTDRKKDDKYCPYCTTKSGYALLKRYKK